MDRKSEVFTRKLTEKYNQDGSPELDSFIAVEVKKLLSKSKQITATDIATVEKKVAVRKNNLSSPSKVSSVMLASERSKLVTEEKMQELTQTEVPLDNYLVFTEAIEFAHKETEKNRKRKEMEHKKKLMRELDEQVDSCKGRDSTDRLIEEKYAEHVRSQHEEWCNSEKKKKQAEIKKQGSIKSQRDAQLAELNQRRHADKERTHREEERIIDNAKAELKKEEDRRKARMQESLAYMNRIKMENVRNQQLREDQRLLAQTEDKRLQKEAADRLDAQERLRAETYAKMKTKSEGNQRMYSLAVADALEKEQEDQEKARLFQLEKLQDDECKAQAKLTAQGKAKRQLEKDLANQVAEFKARRHADEKDKAIFATHYRNDAVQGLKLEKRKEDKRKQAAQEYFEDLKKQIDEKRNRPDDTDTTTMTLQEKRINMPAIGNILTDERVVEAIHQRLSKTRIVDEAKKRSKMGQRGGPRDLQDDDLF